MKKQILTFALLLTTSVVFSQNLIFSGGHYHSAMLCNNGVVYTFGQGTEGQLGQGSFTNSTTPTQVVGLGGSGFLSDIQQVDAGSGAFTIALSECGDTVYTWGENSEGQLGIGNTTNSSVPVRVIGVGGTGFLTDIRFISGGNGEAYVITNDDKVIAWGGNDHGQQGRGTITAGESTPDYVLKGPGDTLSNVKFVDGGDDFGVALLYDGTVWFWGKDARGVGGQGVDVADPGTDRPYAVQVLDAAGTGYLQNITKITAGDRHIMALSSGDTLYSWGANWGRQVGNDNGNTNQPLPTPVLNVNNAGGILTGVRSFAAGNAHSVALLSDGTVVSWGLRRDGHLGDNDIGGCGCGGDGSPYPVYTMNPGNTAPLSGIANVSDGDNWSFAIDSSNNVYIWGRNDEGQLGFGDNTDRLLPVQMSSLPCTIPLPEEPPLASLGGDIDLCSPLSVVLDANDAGSGYTYAWYQDGVLLPSETGQTILVDTAGEFKVTITKTTMTCDGPVLETSSDSINITMSAALPVHGTYCPGGTANLGVIGSGEYKWYDAATGGNEVGTGSNITTPVITGPGTVTFYVEDTSAFSSRVGPAPIPASGGNVRPWDGGSSTTQNQIRFTAIDEFTIDSVTVGAYNGWDGAFAIEVSVIDVGSGTPVATAWSPVMNGASNPTTHQIYLGLQVPAAGDYYLRFTNSTNGDDRLLESSYGAYSAADYPFTDPAGIVTITEHYRDGALDEDRYSLFWDWVISTGSLCDRVPVDAVEDCPACTNPTPNLSLTTGTNPFCEGDTLQLTAGPNGATGTVTYNWFLDGNPISSGTSTTLTINGVTLADAGDYTVTITSTDCATESAASTAVTINVNGLPSITAGSVPASGEICFGENIDLTASGGIAYSWDNSAGTGTPVTVSPTTNTTYTVTGTDVNGCENTDQITITVNSLPAVTAGGGGAICPGDNVNLTASGANTYVWDNMAGTGSPVTVSPASNTTYTVTGTDVNGCENTDQVDVTLYVLPTVTANSDDADNTICNGDAITLTGGGAVSYVWDNSVVDNSPFNPTATTTYTVTGTDANGCENTDDITITVNQAPNITNADLTDDICEGVAAPGLIITSDIGGTTYSWTSTTLGGVTGNTAAGTGDIPSETYDQPGTGSGNVTYTITPTASGCTGSTADYVVTVNPLPSGTGSITPTADVCEGTTETYTISGITDATSYTWAADNGASTTGSTTTTEDITAGSANFTITVTPENVCGTSTPINQAINVNGNTAAAGSITGTTSICDNQTGEGFSISPVTNATSYNWTVTGDASIASGNGTTSITIDFGTDASYTIEVTPIGLCGDGIPEQLVVNNTGSVTVSISLAQNPDPICEGADADIVATVSGGGATPTIEWYVDNVLQVTNSNTTYTMTTPTGGEQVHAILTGSSIGCATGLPANSDTVIVEVEAQPVALITSPAGGSETINTTSTVLMAAAPGVGETGMWSKTNVGEQGNLVAPLNTTSVTLQDLNNFETGIGDGTTNICWTVSSATGTCPDSTDCVDIIRIDVTVPDVQPQSDTICVSSLPHALVTGNPAPNTGNGETATWTAVAGAPFTQVGDDLQPDMVAAGVYQYVYSIENAGLGVVNRDTVTLQVDELPSTADAGSDDAICATTYTLAAVAPTIGSGSWSGASVTFDDSSSETSQVNNLQNGVNTLTWTVVNGVCPSSVATVDIDVVGSVTAPDAGTYATQCETTSSLTLSGNVPGSGETGTWSVTGPGTITDVNNPSATLTITGPGTIDLTWTISNGVCSPDPSDNAQVIVQQAPDVAIAGQDTAVCSDNILLYANTPAVGSGMWLSVAGPIPGTGTVVDNTDPNSSVINITGTITLRWMVTNGTACPPSTDDIEITAIDAVTPEVSLGANQTNICLGDGVTFTASNTANGGTNPQYEFFVDNTSQGAASTDSIFTTTGLINGQQVHVVMTSSEVCVTTSTDASDVITITTTDPVSPVLSAPATICEGSTTSITATVQSGSSLTWLLDGVVQSTGTTTTQTISSISHNGVWQVIENNGVCPVDTSSGVTAVVNAVPVVDAGSDHTIQLGETITIDGTSNVTPVSWSVDVSTSSFNNTSAVDPIFTAVEGGYHVITITADNGTCSATASATIFVEQPLIIPNAFSPNGDGQNDEWVIEGLESYPGATLEVYNRWGSLVYKSTGDINWWTGMRNGQPMPVHTYYYILTLDEEDVRTGAVTLIR